MRSPSSTSAPDPFPNPPPRGTFFWVLMICIQTVVKLCLLLVGQPDLLWNVRDRVPDVLNKLNTLGYA